MNSPLIKLRTKVLCLSLGVTTGVGLAAVGQTLSQGCAGGACLTCGACLSRLPILALPLLAEGVVILGRKVVPLQKRRVDKP
jgi:hypothetical protein